jgi:hypothetical protein
MTSRPGLLVFAWGWLAVAAAAGFASQPGGLTVEREGDRLLLSAPQFHFLEGKPLERLHDGATVTYVLSVTIGPERGGAAWLRLEEPFLLSYDLWEQTFSVVQSKPPRRVASRLGAAAAEAWCLQQLLVRVPTAAADKPFVVELACSVVDDPQPPGNEGFSLSTLIDVLSRKRATAPLRREIRSGPLRLADLHGRGRR